mgnify:CR=1 FL=1
MSIAQKLAEAKEVDAFAALSGEEKAEADWLAEIAVQIHRKRAELGLSQKEFAKVIGVSQAMVSKWERGDYNFSVQTLARVFSKLGIPYTFGMGERRQTHAAPAESGCSQEKSWRAQTTSSEVWVRGAVCAASI